MTSKRPSTAVRLFFANSSPLLSLCRQCGAVEKPRDTLTQSEVDRGVISCVSVNPAIAQKLNIATTSNIAERFRRSHEVVFRKIKSMFLKSEQSAAAVRKSLPRTVWRILAAIRAKCFTSITFAFVWLRFVAVNKWLLNLCF